MGCSVVWCDSLFIEHVKVFEIVLINIQKVVFQSDESNI